MKQRDKENIYIYITVYIIIIMDDLVFVWMYTTIKS